MKIHPIFTMQKGREVCSNARTVIKQIQKFFPNETYQSIARRAGVHFQSIQRWSSIGRADSEAVRRLISSFENEESLDNVLLKNASPTQVRKQCQILGWDKVIEG